MIGYVIYGFENPNSVRFLWHRINCFHDCRKNLLAKDTLLFAAMS